MNTSSATNRSRAGRSGLYLLLFLAVPVAQLLLSGSMTLFTRNLWLDELHTFAIAADPDLGHALAALKSGVDGCPPTSYILLRSFCALAGGAGETSLRLFSFLCMMSALAGLFLLFRGAFTPLVAFTAVVATWAHPMVFRLAFEARFYALLLAATVWFAWFLARAGRWARRPASWVALALSSMLLCTVHYFGIVSMFLIVASDFLYDPKVYREKKIYLPAIALGPAALLTAMSYYFGQKSGVPHLNHIPAVNVGQLLRFVGDLFPFTHFPFLVAACWLSVLWFAVRRPPSPPGEPEPGWGALAGLTGLVFFPAVLLAHSLAIHSIMVSRYAATTLAAVAVLIAFLLSKTARPLVAALLVLFLGAGAGGLRFYAHSARGNDAETAALIEAVRAMEPATPVLFEISRDLVPVCHYAPELIDRCFLLDFEEGQITGVDKFRVSVRDAARVMERHYGAPALLPWHRAIRLPRWYLVPGHRRNDDLAAMEKDYPGFSASPVARDLILMTASPAGAVER